MKSAAAAIIAGVVGFLANLWDKWKTVRLARKADRLEGKVADHERANEIRDRVDDADADDVVRKFDDAGWRD